MENAEMLKIRVFNMAYRQNMNWLYPWRHSHYRSFLTTMA